MADDPFTHLVCTGACYIDTILTVPTFPKEDAKQRASSFLRRRGGNCPNTFEVLRQLLSVNSHTLPHAHRDDSIDGLAFCLHPLQLFLLTILPAKDSTDIKFIRDSLSQICSPPLSTHPLSHESACKPISPTVEMSYSFYRPSQTQAASSYVIKSLETNSRTIVNYNALDDMTLAEFQTAVTTILAAKSTTKRRVWFHFEGRIPDITRQCMMWLRHSFPGTSPSNSPVAVEIVISIELEHPARPGLERLAAYADVVFYSRSWAEGWGGYDSIAGCLRGEVQRIREMHASDENAQHIGEDTAGYEEDRASSMHNARASLPRKMTLCCTWGEHGAGAVEMDTRPDIETRSTADLRPSHVLDIVERPAWHPSAPTSTARDIVDTVGAGDTWTAGMLFTFLSLDPTISKWDLARRVDFANEVAGRKILREGFGGLGQEMMGQLKENEAVSARLP